MNQFLELAGVSGARYRFRRAPDVRSLPAEGGNFIFVRHVNDRAEVLLCGADETLHEAATYWSEAVEKHGADAIYTRLNIARKQRLIEHADILDREIPIMNREA